MSQPLPRDPSTQRLAAAYFDAAPDAIIAVDGDGLITMVNQQAEILFGYERDELLDQSVEMLIPRDLRQVHQGHRRHYANESRTRPMGDQTTILHGLTKAGVLIPVDVALSPVASEAATGALAIVRDLRPRIEAEQDRDRRAQLFSALAEIRQSTLMEQPIEAILEMTLESTSRLLQAAHTFVAVPSVDGGLTYRSMRTKMTPNYSGLALPESELIKTVLDGGRPMAVASVNGLSGLGTDGDNGFGPGFIAPLVASGSLAGILAAVRSAGEPEFSEDEIGVGASLASEIAVTLDLVKARADRRRMFLVEDRERIARDLHDVVIQRLFAAGMGLQAALGAKFQLEEKVAATVDELDETIDVIRETIFHLTQPDLSLEGELQRIVDRFRTVGRNDVSLTISGDLDEINEILADNLTATLNELLSNVERHAEADSAEVCLEIGDAVTLTVADDGVGFDEHPAQGFGLHNITQRAEYLDGSVVIQPGPDGVGTTVTWTVTLS